MHGTIQKVRMNTIMCTMVVTFVQKLKEKMKKKKKKYKKKERKMKMRVVMMVVGLERRRDNCDFVRLRVTQEKKYTHSTRTNTHIHTYV